MNKFIISILISLLFFSYQLQAKKDLNILLWAEIPIEHFSTAYDYKLKKYIDGSKLDGIGRLYINFERRELEIIEFESGYKDKEILDESQIFILQNKKNKINNVIYFEEENKYIFTGFGSSGEYNIKGEISLTPIDKELPLIRTHYVDYLKLILTSKTNSKYKRTYTLIKTDDGKELRKEFKRLDFGSKEVMTGGDLEEFPLGGADKKTKRGFTFIDE
ncbi:hypothetical protein DID80_04855 [Candidatus Marinamargulisbacteria bacterium SCGC AAA071-K20]|nr:hypothetical protein DID80_04855 [Candidatus Marinamargulisbacteria bacterium SCGC AAA071-K20]